MCLAYLAIGADPEWPLFIAANRDEFHSRPTRAGMPWPERKDIIAGLDLEGGGTWLGVSRAGRYALLTNYRDPRHTIPGSPSRGALVRDFLEGEESAYDYACRIAENAARFNGFNLIVGTLDEACYLGNRSTETGPRRLQQGSRHVLSNHLLDTNWPKAQRLRQALDSLDLATMHHTVSPVLKILRDPTRATDELLPETGIPTDRERLLSSPFIVSPDYGTRSSTIIAIHASGKALLSETSYGPSGIVLERHDWPFLISEPDQKRKMKVR